MSSEQSQDESALAETEPKSEVRMGQDPDDYLLMVNSVSDYAIILLDAKGYVVSWNPGAERFKGYTAQEIIGQHFSTFYPEEAINRGFPDEELRVASEVGRFEDEGWRVRKDGTQFWANVIITTLRDKSGKVRGFAKLTRDLTERKQAEESLRRAHDMLEDRVAERTAELIQANEALHDAKMAAEAASHAKSDFLSRMSHELRTPLNSILGFGQLLSLSQLSSEDEEHVGYILKSGHHLLKLVNEVLDIARVEAGRIDLSIEPLLVAEVLKESINLIRGLAVNSRIALECSEALQQQVFVMADHQRLKQVFINLLSNAIKYNRPEGKIEISCTSENELITIAIRDTGVGISQANLSKLFTPFERLEAGKSSIEGTGLGLAFSKRMMEAMKGDLRAESVLEEGSVFYIDLPLAESQVQHVEEQAKDLETSGHLATKAAQVLLIEDNFSNYQLVERILAYRPNIELIGAMQGRIGLDMARHNNPGKLGLTEKQVELASLEVERIRTANRLLKIRCTETMRAIGREVGEITKAYDRHREMAPYLLDNRDIKAPGIGLKFLEAFLKSAADENGGQPASQQIVDFDVEWLRWWRWNSMLGLEARSYEKSRCALYIALSSIIDGEVTVRKCLDPSIPTSAFASQTTLMELIVKGERALIAKSLTICGFNVGKRSALRLELCRVLEQVLDCLILQIGLERRFIGFPIKVQ